MQEQEITLKNTKAEILEALNAALHRAEAAEKGKLNPEKAEKERTEKRVVASAKESVAQNVFSQALIDKFNDLQAAIAVEESRLEDIYGAGRQLQKLALIIEAGNAQLEAIEAEKTAKTEEAQSSLEKLRAEYTQKKAELQEDYDTAAKKLKQSRDAEQEAFETAVQKQRLDRDREQEAYTYQLQRTRDKENDDWEDEKSTRLAALAGREAEAAALLTEAEAKTRYTADLEAQVSGIPALLEKERKTAGEETAQSLTKEYEYKSALAAKDYESTITRLTDKLDRMEKELDGANKAHDALLTKLDKAYAEMKELATKTVESASGVKIIGGGPESK